jgi:hypothetical protein
MGYRKADGSHCTDDGTKRDGTYVTLLLISYKLFIVVVDSESDGYAICL